MISNERQQEILTLLSEKGNVSVEELAQQLDVSKMTIRRDLEKLQDNNLLQRTHGGAIINKVLFHEVSYQKKREKNIHSKQQIAELAINYIEPESTIFLDAGTTTFELALKLVNIGGLTIITNDLMIASHLYTTDHNIIFIGGTIQRETGSTTGSHALRMLDELNIDMSIISASSIDSNLMLCTPDEGKQALKQKVLQIAEKTILLVDSSKFYRKALYKIESLKNIDLVLSDLEPSDLEELNLEDVNVKTT